MTSRTPPPNRIRWVRLLAGTLFVGLAIYSLFSAEKLGVWAYGYSVVLIGFGIYSFSTFSDFSRLKVLLPKSLQSPGVIAAILLITIFVGIVATSVLLESEQAGWEEIVAAILLGFAGWIFWGTLLLGVLVLPIWGLYKLAEKRGSNSDENWE